MSVAPPHYTVPRRPLVTTDGVRIDAAHLAGGAGTRGPAIVLAHGFTASWRRPALRRIAGWLAGSGPVICFDFRGHGRSTGSSTLGDREVLDLAAAVDYARDLGYAEVATVGFSMGAAVVVRYAGLTGGLAAAVAVSGPSRWFYRDTAPMRRLHWAVERRAGRAATRVLRRTRIATDGFDPVPESPVEVAPRIAPTPLLIVHGDSDPFFPLDHPRQLFEAAREPKELWIEPGYGHAEGCADADLVRRIGAWVTANRRPGR